MMGKKLLGFAQKIDAISNRTGRAVSILLLSLIAVVLYGAFMRYVVKDMPSWAYEVSIFMYGTIAFGAGNYCLLHQKHVSVDIFKNKFSPGVKKIADIIYSLTAIGCMSVIIYYAGIWAYESTLILERSEHMTSFNPQIWWFKWIVVLSIFGVILQAFSDIVKVVYGHKASDCQVETR